MFAISLLYTFVNKFTKKWKQILTSVKFSDECEVRTQLNNT